MASGAPAQQELEICFQLVTVTSITNSVLIYEGVDRGTLSTINEGGERRHTLAAQDWLRKFPLIPHAEGKYNTEYNIESTNFVTNETLYACAAYTVDVSTILFDESVIYRVVTLEDPLAETPDAVYGVACALTST